MRGRSARSHGARSTSVSSTDGPSASGIHTIAGAKSVLTEGNQVIGWTRGIRAEADPTKVEKNEIARCARGIEAGGTSIVSGDVLNDNDSGMYLAGHVTVTGNALLGNNMGIFLTGAAFAGTIQKNNFIGDRGCGVQNFSGAVGLPATNNYWGATTGPGAAPADHSGPGSGCDFGAGTTTVTPFATKPFNVKAPIKP
jgi:nitrous oxidase accessory protein NosD